MGRVFRSNFTCLPYLLAGYVLILLQNISILSSLREIPLPCWWELCIHNANASAADHDSWIEAVQSARQQTSRITHEWALHEKTLRDQKAQLYRLDVGKWILVRRENPQKFESKWFRPYQIVEKMMLGTYQLQDLNKSESVTLVHVNQLVKASISSADELIWRISIDQHLRKQWFNHDYCME